MYMCETKGHIRKENFYLGFLKETPEINSGFVVFFFNVQSHIAVRSLTCMYEVLTLICCHYDAACFHGTHSLAHGNVHSCAVILPLCL